MGAARLERGHDVPRHKLLPLHGRTATVSGRTFPRGSRSALMRSSLCGERGGINPREFAVGLVSLRIVHFCSPRPCQMRNFLRRAANPLAQRIASLQRTQGAARWVVPVLALRRVKTVRCADQNQERNFLRHPHSCTTPTEPVGENGHMRVTALKCFRTLRGGSGR